MRLVKNQPSYSHNFYPASHRGNFENPPQKIIKVHSDLCGFQIGTLIESLNFTLVGYMQCCRGLTLSLIADGSTAVPHLFLIGLILGELDARRS